MEENEKSIKSLNQKEEYASKNNNNFYLTLYNNIYSTYVTEDENKEKIIIKVKNESTNNNINHIYYYENSFSLEELITKSKPFKLCDTIDDALQIFIDILKGNKAFLNRVEQEENYNNDIDNTLLFIIKISLPGGQEQDVEFELNKKNMNKDEYINELVKIIEKLNIENEELKYELFNKNNEIKLLNKKLGVNNNTITFESNKSFNSKNKNKSFDSKRNLLTSGGLNYKNNIYKYSYHDIHNNNDIHNIINYHTLYNSNNININKLNDKDENNYSKITNNLSKFFQNSMSSFKKGRLNKYLNDSSQFTNDFFESKSNLLIKNNNKENKENNITKINTFKKSKNKKKEILLNNVIYIKNDLNKVSMIPIEEYESIRQIKKRYCDKKCIPIKGKELYYKGKKLSEERNLEFYNIPWESTLYVLNIPDKINVYVRCLSGKEFKIIADEFETILKIKIKIYEYENIPIDKQIVLLNKKILDDDKTLSEFNNNGDIHLLVRKKGEF